ncbi:MAG: DNA mismatch repair protein MutS, partial [Clostridia bacterium]
MASVTPMMQQYLRLKEENQGTILFFRLGDFYEMFFEDAILVSRELELMLTGKDCGLEERAPMCGVPFHSAEVYINRLVEKGYKVAICEQMTDPALSKGLVERAVVRIVTPGTVTEESMLEEKANNYLLALCMEGARAGVAFADVTTGECFVFEVEDACATLQDELASISPTEILANEAACTVLAPYTFSAPLSRYDARAFGYVQAKKAILAQFHLQDLFPLGMEEMHVATCAAGALLHYLQETQRNAMEHITGVRLYARADHLLLDCAARRNLELTESLRKRGRSGTLIELLDHTATAMGGRLLRNWVEQPLARRALIDERLEAVSALKDAHMVAQTLYDNLRQVHDIERLLS